MLTDARVRKATSHSLRVEADGYSGRAASAVRQLRPLRAIISVAAPERRHTVCYARLRAPVATLAVCRVASELAGRAHVQVAALAGRADRCSKPRARSCLVSRSVATLLTERRNSIEDRGKPLRRGICARRPEQLRAARRG